MAEVHLGFDTRLSCAVVIKMPRRDLAQDSIFRTRSRYEAQLATSLDRPNIAAVYDTDEKIIESATSRSIAISYIATEYVEGHTVKDLIPDGTAVPINEAIEAVPGVLSALQYSHANHLVHHNIKPGNIILMSGGKVRVTDFDIAHAPTDSQATMIQMNAVVGTAQYLSLEQARGETVDACSGLYSTGVVLFKLSMGRPPFKDDSTVAVAYQYVEQTLPTPSSVLPDIPDSLDYVVLKSLAKNHEDRYPSAAAMLADLQRVARGLDVGAPPTDSWATEVLPAAGMASVHTAATTPMVAVPSHTSAATMVATSTPLPAVATKDAADEAAKTYKHHAAIIATVLFTALLLIGGSAWTLTHGAAEPRSIVVPNVVSLAQAEAETRIEQAGFTWKLNPDKVAFDTVVEGSMTSTDSATGVQAEKSATVHVTISSSSDSVTLPDDLAGMSPDGAREAIEAPGLKWELDSSKVASDTVSKDKVAQTSPSPGSRVRAGQTIRAYSPFGSDQVDVPNLPGMTQDQTRSAFKGAGLGLGNATSADSGKGEDRIAEQDPTTGTRAKKGTAIDISILSGKAAQVGISTVVGMGRKGAEVQLKAPGLAVIIEEVAGNQPTGQALPVEPGKGSKMERGSAMKLKVSKGNQKRNNGDDNDDSTNTLK